MEIESFKLKEMIEKEVNNKLLSKYPIGSIYMSVNSTNPSTFIGGTWEQLKDKFLLGVGNVYKENEIGGASTVSLTAKEMPSHTHSLNTPSACAVIQLNDGGSVLYGEFTSTVATKKTYKVDKTGGVGESIPNGEENYWGAKLAGDTSIANTTSLGQAHNNMPPYLAVYMWKRVS